MASDSGYNIYKNAGRLVVWDPNVTPAPGDFIFLRHIKSGKISNHTAIGSSVDGDIIGTVEGNWNNAVVTRDVNKRTDQYIIGYGRNSGY